MRPKKYNPRNSGLTKAPSGKKLFDIIIEKGDQAKLENDPDFQDLGGTRIENADLRDKYHARYEDFLKLPQAKDVIAILREYITKCIPFPVRTEGAYWSCSCLPSGGSKNNRVLARMNINWQENLSLYLVDEKLLFSFHVARSPLEEILHSREPDSNSFEHPDFYEVTSTGHMYVPGGFDQIELEGTGANNALKLLENTDFLQAARLLNLRLFQRGRNPYSNSHCFDLVDQILNPLK